MEEILFRYLLSFSITTFSNRFLAVASFFFFFTLLKYIFLFLLNLLGWHCLTILYRFQMHNSTTHHLCTVLCSPHWVSSHHHLPPLYPPLPPPPTPTSTSLVSLRSLFCSIPPPAPSSPPCPYSSQPAVHESVSNLLVSS